MKNLLFKTAFFFFAFTICSFQMPNPTVQEIFQEALNLEELENQLIKDSQGAFLPLTLVTNDFLSEKIDLNIDGQRIKVVNKLAIDYQSQKSVLELTEVKLKGKKSIIGFKYGAKTIKIRLKQIDGAWVGRTITVKSKGEFSTQVVSKTVETY